MRVALDTDILTYAEGAGDEARCNAARNLLVALSACDVLVPAQALGELYRVLTGKLRRAGDTVRTALLDWSDAYEIADSTWPAFQAAIDLASDHRLQIWDGLMLAVAAENRCRMLLSEDLQHGFTWRGVTVVNPFEHARHPLLVAACGRR